MNSNTSNGFFVIWRRLFEHPLWLQSNATQKVILITLIAMANHEEKKWFWKGKEITCKAGQFVTSLESIAKKAGDDVSTKQVRTMLEKLEKYNFLANESSSKGRLITIEKYSYWQYEASKEGKQEGKQWASNGQAEGKQRATNNNITIKQYNNINNILGAVPEPLRDVFKDFMQMREDMGKPIKSEATVKGVLAELEKISKRPEKQVRIIEQSIARGWLRFYPLDEPVEPPSYKQFEKEQPTQATPMPEYMKETVRKLVKTFEEEKQ